ncbi:MAG TPA: hypothetical protein VEH06_14970 [Candidatus Bathyarchaeia archaeon]|nr:hypothetical protein [Candidatus Bathyarchaeia archaeon]
MTSEAIIDEYLERDMPRFRCYDHGSDNTKSFTSTWLLFFCSGHELSAKTFIHFAWQLTICPKKKSKFIIVIINKGFG